VTNDRVISVCSVVCHPVPSFLTSDPDFKVTTLLDIEYLRNDTRYSHSYYRTSIEKKVVCVLSNGDISNDLDGP